jgi:NAD(P)-dependent dehydrogenase (short-subunit alcohol dehydrogenase family)
MGAGGQFWRITDAEWDAVWSVNVLGTRRLIEAAALTLIANGPAANSRIVAVASAAGSLGLRHLAAYSAAKHAVVGLIRGVAMDLAEYGVTANAVSPGSTRTAILEATAQVYGLASGEEFAAQQPIGRLLDPIEIAAAIVWVCSAGSSAVTGADLAIDGGMTVS